MTSFNRLLYRCRLAGTNFTRGTNETHIRLIAPIFHKLFLSVGKRIWNYQFHFGTSHQSKSRISDWNYHWCEETGNGSHGGGVNQIDSIPLNEKFLALTLIELTVCRFCWFSFAQNALVHVSLAIYDGLLSFSWHSIWCNHTKAPARGHISIGSWESRHYSET